MPTLRLFIAVALTAPTLCAEAPPLPEWETAGEGVALLTYATLEPEPLALYAARIDLETPGLRFLVTPANGEAPGEVSSRTTSSFLEEFDCFLAVNASPYGPVVATEGEAQDVVGLSVSKGDAYSEEQGPYGEVYISEDNEVWFSGEQPPGGAEPYNAAGGFHMLLENGENVGADGDRHPRTAVGVSEDRRYLYLVVIDGRQTGYSVGATTAETAEWMKRLGAHGALNLDGGGSATMVVRGDDGEAKVVNRPIHMGIIGKERPNANHIGVLLKGD
jgi:hypothetical protein